MLIFGDNPRRVSTSRRIDDLRDLVLAAMQAAGIERHQHLVAALIDCGELVQGLADANSDLGGADQPHDVVDVAMDLCVALAREVWASWSAGFGSSDQGALQQLGAGLLELGKRVFPSEIEIKQPEGFAYYALYPESYAAVAHDLPSGGELRLIGIRSIGTTLVATLAGALARGGERPVTVRPTGHPFRRDVSFSPRLEAALMPTGQGSYAVADEGPGQSGSSMAAVALALERLGVPLDRVHLLPSHPGEPGPASSPEIARVWKAAHRHVRTFDDIVLGAERAEHRLESWARDLIGEAKGGLVEASAGRWREHGLDRWTTLPPVHAWQERRKFIARTDTGAWLLKFAGLDRSGREKARTARTLHEGGFIPEPAGWRHGFTVERWHADARSVDADGPARSRLVRHLGTYLGFRARTLPAAPGSGATLEALEAMARQNIAEGLGDVSSNWLAGWRPDLARLDRRSRPVRTDNRLHVWEWLDVGGRILKADGLDHDTSHDLVGSQDIAWDIAGAVVEFDLAGAEAGQLTEAVERESGEAVDPALVGFLLPCYLAFQLGYYVLAVSGAPDDEERQRLSEQVTRYRGHLVDLTRGGS